MAKILVLTGVPGDGFNMLREAGHQVVIPREAVRHFTREEVMAEIADTDAVVACSTFDADMIRAAKKLKVITAYGAGYDNVDWREAARLGIPVTNIPWTVTDATAELAVGLMLSVCRRIGEMDLRVRREQPETLFGMGRYMSMTLKGATLGIIGAGRIGNRTAELAKAFGMQVIGYSRRGADPAYMEPVSFDEAVARADVLSIHCPLTNETRGLISRDVMLRMKPGSVLVNTARGAVCDYDALCEMIDNGHLAGAGLDVYPDEPHIPEQLIARERIVLTPHAGSNTLQTRNEMAEACSRQILDVLAGRKPAPIVNGL